MKTSMIRMVLAASLAATAACGSAPSSTGAAGPTGPAPASVVVSLAPLASQVAPGGTITFTASVTGSVDTGVVWSVQEGATGGSVSAAGVYMASAAAGTYHVAAASHADASKVQVATVTVVAPVAPVVSVSVGPATSTVDACGTVAFSSTVTGSANQGVSWSVREGPSGGTITTAGMYTAPSTAGTYHVVATSVADPARTSEAVVTVAAERVLAVAVAPGSGTVTPKGALGFSAMVTTTCGTFAAQ